MYQHGIQKNFAGYKKELAEILNCLQCHTKCAPGYCEWRRKKDTGKIFCQFGTFGYPKICRDHSEFSRDPGHEFFFFLS